MSERGLLLALQRLHDDPGFIDMVCSDPEHTLGLYDLDESDRSMLSNACQKKDTGALTQLARSYGIEWEADHVQGVGALDDSEVSIEHQHIPKPTPGVLSHTSPVAGSGDLHSAQPGALPGDGYEGVQPSAHTNQHTTNP
jgi:hypothetical protein